jgi:hypothetical protein
MSQVFDDLVQQVDTIQQSADDHEQRLQPIEEQFSQGLRSQLEFPLDETSTQLIQEAAGTANIAGGNVVGGAAGGMFPTGWSVSHLAAGLYQITHTLNTSNYSVVATPNVFASRWISVYSKTSTTFNIAIANTAGTATDTDFDFIVTY